MSEMYRPRSLSEAVAIFGENPDLVPVAGCTDLMVGDWWRKASLGRFLDLTSVADLRGISMEHQAVEIGATTSFATIGDSRQILEHFPALAAAAKVIGGWQIQNRATLGGNIVNASPAGDSLPVLLALDATVRIAGTKGIRELPLGSFYRGYRRTDLRSGEILAAVRIGVPPVGSRQYFRKVGTRNAQAISKVVVAFLGRVDEGKVVDYRLAAGSVAPTPVRLSDVENEMVGRAAEPGLADRAGSLAAESVSPIDDVRSTAAYRRFALQQVVCRMTLDLVSGA